MKNQPRTSNLFVYLFTFKRNWYNVDREESTGNKRYIGKHNIYAHTTHTSHERERERERGMDYKSSKENY